MSTFVKIGGKGLAYERLKSELYGKILNGDWPVNSRIPAEHSLAQEYKLSRGTIRKALKSLEEEGFLRAEQGRGRIVTHKAQEKTATKNIGIILHRISADFYGDIMSIQQASREKGYNLVIYVLQDIACADNMVQQISDISKKEVSGLIVYCQEVLNADIIEFNKYLPTVALYHNCAPANIPSYFIDWSWVTYELSLHLLEQEYENQILILPNGPFWGTVNTNILSGMNYACHKYGIKFNEESLYYVPSDASGTGYEKSIEGLLEKLKDNRDTGIITYYNWPAINIIRYAIEHNLNVPKEIGVATLVDGKFLEQSPIPITAIEYNHPELARQATLKLIDILENQNTGKISENKTIAHPYYGRLIPRSSTARKTGDYRY